MLAGNIPVFNRGVPGYQGAVIDGNDQFTVGYWNFDAGYPNGTGWANLGVGSASLPNPAIAGGPGVKNDGGSPVSGGVGSLDCNVPNGYGAAQSDTSQFDFGAPGAGNGPGDFTVDWWEYRPNTLNNSVSLCRNINAAYQGWAAGYIAGASGTTAQTFYASTNNTGWDIASAQPMGSPSLNAWHHLAFGRIATTWGTWLDGVPQAAWTAGGTPLAGGTLSLGCWNAASSAIFNARIFYDELRISKGICRYYPNQGFVPRTWAPYGTVKSGGNDANCKALLHFDGSLADSAAGAAAHTFTAAGSAALITSDKQFGSGCLQVGQTTTARITTPQSTDFDFGSGNFTIEFWAKRLSPGTGVCSFFAKRNLSSEYAPLQILDSGTNIACYASSNGSAWDIMSNVVLVPTQGPINTWIHWAFVRLGNNLLTFANGVIQSCKPFVGTLWANNNVVSIGGLSDLWSAPYLFDEYRVSKQARYFENFYPVLPNQPF